VPRGSGKEFAEFAHANATQPGWTVGEIVHVQTEDDNPDSWQFAAMHEDGTLVTCYTYSQLPPRMKTVPEEVITVQEPEEDTGAS
jgi:hypothetical protein